jgi:hypothetical protein
MRGPDGLAVAQWASAVLSVLAIAIALYVFLAEQRRGNAEKQREAAREREAIERAEAEQLRSRRYLMLAVIGLLNESLTVMTTDLPGLGEMYVQWLPDRGKPLELRAFKTSIEAVMSATVNDVELLLALAKASSILDATISPPNIGQAPHVSAVLHVLQNQSDALESVRTIVEATHARLQVAR